MLVVANRDHLSPWMPWAAGQGLAETRAFIDLTRKQIADDGGLQTTIVHAGRIQGMVGCHGIDWDARATSIGYWIDASCQGRGMVARAVRALVDHAFSVWDLNRVEIRAAPENRRSPGDSRAPRVHRGGDAAAGRADRRALPRQRRLRDARRGLEGLKGGEPRADRAAQARAVGLEPVVAVG